PVVRMISPANGSVFHAPIDLPLFAFANDPDGSVASVEFFAGTNSLGFGQHIPVPVAAGATSTEPVPPIFPTNLFFLVWSNAPIGIYPLTAVATDNGGASTTSAPPVNITILPPLPPPTNRPPLISIVATDPVAIEGTNCWVWPGETNSPPTWAAWPTAVCRYFTNCGPKIATFTVRRFGDTNSDVTVPYDIGGTASNGVDYVALPGLVSIPAGERHALITIVPIDDGPPDLDKTVILTLTADTNIPPDYLLGFPRRAAAIIIDHGPCPATGMLPGGCFHLVTPGPDAAWFAVEHSTDLVNWTAVCTNQVINGSIDFVDPDAQSNSSGFYRAVPLTDPPSE
ncbi:MAG TPA: Ig-like domain-containing protein, partial [Verrucomicrobiae bacterium]|nr:Ig-like domain-containing protein [Verrucomicrobiae bacterium]